MRVRRLSDDYRDAPGPGDLDLGEGRCLGGACPHDHDSLDMEDEYGDSEWGNDYEQYWEEELDTIPIQQRP